MDKVLIIAEAGVNHNGDLALAKTMVAKAAEAGADIVKFQSGATTKNISKNAPKAQYQIDATGAAETQYEMVRKLELSRQSHEILIAECKKCKIRFFSTAFDQESLAMLMELGADMIKIPSGEIVNLPLLRMIARCGKPVILSTGMAKLGEVEAAIEILEQGGLGREQLTLLQCNTEYPTPYGDANLRAMQNMGRMFGVAFGYSDHTVGIEVPVAAVALGAAVIEKHFTLDRTMPGPDHKASLEPDELKAMVAAIRHVEQALGDGIKRPTASEVKNRPIARKSLVAACAIAKGELFSDANLTAKRPGTGISPMRWDEIVGQPAPRAFAEDEMIEL